MSFYRLFGRALYQSAKTGATVGNRAGAAVQDLVAGRPARGGVLGPGDPTPPPSVGNDFLDYRGVASLRELAPLQGHPFTLGRAVDPRRWKPGRKAAPISLPFEMLRRHAIVLGPSGAGKTDSVIIPWIHAALGLGASVIALDVKGDLKDRLRDYATTAGRLGVKVRTWDYSSAAGQSVSWNWIGALTTEERLDAAIVGLLGREEQMSGRSDLYRMDYEILKGLLLYARALFRRPITARELCDALDRAELEANFKRGPGVPGFRELGTYASLDPADFAKATIGVRTALSTLCTDAIDDVTRTPQLDLDHVLEENALLVVGSPLAGGVLAERLSALALGVIQQRLNERLRRGGSSSRPVFVFVDEAGPLLDRFDIARVLTTIRSGGVSFVLGFQAAEQIEESERGTVLGNAAVTIAMRGMSHETAEHLAARWGQRTQQTYSDSVGGGWSSRGASRQVGRERVPVLSTREMLALPFGNHPAVVSLVGPDAPTFKPILVDLRRADL